MEGKKNRVRATSKPTVTLVRSDYQPSKAELREETILPGIEGKSLDQVAQKVLQSVNIKWVDTAWSLKHKLMQVMKERDESGRLGHIVQVDDAYLGGETRGGKRGRGAQGKTPFVAAVKGLSPRVPHRRYQLADLVPRLAHVAVRTPPLPYRQEIRITSQAKQNAAKTSRKYVFYARIIQNAIAPPSTPPDHTYLGKLIA